MGVLNKADFYYGALLSELINSGFAPAIFEKGDIRRIYSLSNDHGDFVIYAKYASNTSSQNSHTIRWQFSFTDDELDRIRSFYKSPKQHYFAFICGVNELKGSEIAILPLAETMECLGLGHHKPPLRITIKSAKGKRGLGVYGTGRADKIDGKPNWIRVPRDIISCFNQTG